MSGGYPYNTARWKRLRKLKLSSAPLCEDCKGFGLVKPAAAVDHVLPVKHGGLAYPELSGLRSLCWRCHSAKTAQGVEAGAAKTDKPRRGCDANGRPLDAAHPWAGGGGAADRARPPGLLPSGIPLTTVCGPPCSGKTSYVRERAGGGDVVIDLDDILVELSGERRYAVAKRWLPAALDRRNDMLRSLARASGYRRAWFIVGAGGAEERTWWQRCLGGDIVLLAVPADECVRRLRLDASREGQTLRLERVVHEWWERFSDAAPSHQSHQSVYI